tara:strand:- start:932 stop:1138 length:207 start_codon:yes stop_codon:yes gene_type:complete
MDKKKYIENRIEQSTNPVLKGMWKNALINLNSPRRKVTWDAYYLYMGFVCNTKQDKRQLEARKRLHNG